MPRVVNYVPVGDISNGYVDSMICVMQLNCSDGRLDIQATVSSEILKDKLVNQITSLTYSTDVLTVLSHLNSTAQTLDNNESIFTGVKQEINEHNHLVNSHLKHAQTETVENGFVIENKIENDLKSYDGDTDDYDDGNDIANDSVVNDTKHDGDESEPTIKPNKLTTLKTTKLKKGKKLKMCLKKLKSLQNTKKPRKPGNPKRVMKPKEPKQRKIKPIIKIKSKSTITRPRNILDATDVGVYIGEPKEYPVQCSYCRLMFRLRYSLQHHIRTAHAMPDDARPYSCSTCGRKFKMVHILLQHLYTHVSDADKPYKCEEHCDKRFSTKHQLQQHELIFKNIREFRCELCDKSWASAAALKDHNIMHSNTTPFLCTECGQAFRRKSQLMRHSFKHLEKVYQCEQCGKAFSSLFDVTRHSVIHDPDRVRYQCPYCSVSVCKATHLKRHLKNVHKNILGPAINKVAPKDLSSFTSTFEPPVTADPQNSARRQAVDTDALNCLHQQNSIHRPYIPPISIPPEFCANDIAALSGIPSLMWSMTPHQDSDVAMASVAMTTHTNMPTTVISRPSPTAVNMSMSHYRETAVDMQANINRATNVYMPTSVAMPTNIQIPSTVAMPTTRPISYESL